MAALTVCLYDQNPFLERRRAKDDPRTLLSGGARASGGLCFKRRPSYRYRNRYNIADRFGALYFADRYEVCRATLEKRGLLSARSRPHVLLTFKIQAGPVVDLTDPVSWKALELDRSALVRTGERPDAYETTHHVAAAVYHAGLSGLLAPDATETGRTLVLYPARLLARNTIHLVEKTSF